MNSHSFQDDELVSQHHIPIESDTTIEKQLILESSHHPSKQYLVKIPYYSRTRQLDLGQVLHDILFEIIPHSHTYQVFYYNNESEYFIFAGMFPFQDLLVVSQEDIPESFIFVRINRIHPPSRPNDEEPNKKKRVNDRTIKEVLTKVAQWRKIHQTKGVTLEEAAKQCQLPKKTLDDYFYHIRQAQIYNFDFQKNLGQKIGVLRKFVKQNHRRKQNSEVKVIQQFMNNEKSQEE